MRIVRLIILFSILSLLSSSGCQKKTYPETKAIHLVDLFHPEFIQFSAQAKIRKPRRTVWTFDQSHDETLTWKPALAVRDLRVENGKLTGSTTSDWPIIELQRNRGLRDRDLLDAVEVRLRVSAGDQLSVQFESRQRVDLEDIVATARDFPWQSTASIEAGKEFRTYRIPSTMNVLSSDIRHIFLRPTNAPEASFEIESVRLIFRKEVINEIPSGVGWQGLSEIYRESLISRSPEMIRFSVQLPRHPWLDLAIGTIQPGPLTFEVSVQRERSDEKSSVFQRAVQLPYRWQGASVDLERYAGERVNLLFSLSSKESGAVGFWGAPVIRNSDVLSGESKQDFPRGVILIWVDTLRRDHLEIYGYHRPTAPNIKKLADRGVTFTDAVSPATWTKPATTSLFTSRYVASHGADDFSRRLPSSAVTLAQLFRNAGYATLSLSSILWTGQFSNLQKGFEELHEAGSLPQHRSSKTAAIYVDRLMPWLKAHRNVPFFVFLHVTDPHQPYRPAAPYDTLWTTPEQNKEHMRQTDKVRDFIADPVLKLCNMPTKAEIQKAGFDPERYISVEKSWYDGSIQAMDTQIGLLLQQLRSSNLEDRTLVVLSADHGEEFLEHGRMFHGQSVYGELSNVPLVIAGPGVQRGKRISQTVSTIDLMPTLLDLCRLKQSSGQQGVSLRALLQNNSSQIDYDSRGIVCEKPETHEPLGAPPPRDTASVSLTMNGWKLIFNSVRPAGRPEYELYDERKDPLNLKDLAGSRRQMVLDLAKRVQSWQSRARAERLKPDSETNKKLSPEEIERLRSLGYL